MNLHEEEMQNQLENGRLPEGDNLDVRAYQEVFRALKKDPGYSLTSRFAERVAARIVARRQSMNSRDYFWFAAGISLLLLTSIATILMTGFRFNFGFLNAMSDYKGLVAFGIIFITLLNWLDKRMVRGRQAHH